MFDLLRCPVHGSASDAGNMVDFESYRNGERCVTLSSGFFPAPDFSNVVANGAQTFVGNLILPGFRQDGMDSVDEITKV